MGKPVCLPSSSLFNGKFQFSKKECENKVFTNANKIENIKKHFYSSVNQRRKYAPHQEIHVVMPQTKQIKDAHAVLQVPLWGGTVTVPHQGQVNLVNTCPIDNFLTIFYVLMKTRNKFFQYLLRSPELYAVTLLKICKMVIDGNFAEGKCEWLKLFPGRFNLAQLGQLDLWGNEDDLFVSRLYSAGETSFTSTCQSPHCLSGVKQICSKAITLRYM